MYVPSHMGKVPDCQQRQYTFLDGALRVSIVATLAESKSIFSLILLSNPRRVVTGLRDAEEETDDGVKAVVVVVVVVAWNINIDASAVFMVAVVS